MLLARARTGVVVPPIDPIPDPPPDVSTTLATYVFTSSGWAVVGLVLPEGAATGDVIINGGLGHQTEVRTTWPDGSVRYAVLASYIPAAGSYNLMEGNDTAGAPLEPTWPNVTLEFTISGTVWTATLPAFVADENGINGVIVREARAIFTPMNGATPHPLLQVVADIRTVYGNQHRIDLCIQNVKDIAAGGPVTYDLVIKRDGAAIYSKSAFVHNYWTRHRKVFTYYGEAYCQPDFAPFIEAQAIPEYLSTVVNPVPSYGAYDYDIGGFGDMSADMGGPGGRPEIAPYPNFTAHYLVHKTQAQFDFMIDHANLSGSWRNHVALADGTTVVNRDLAGYGNYWLYQPAPTLPLGAGPQAARVDFNGSTWAGGYSHHIETAHHPSLNFIPYLVTGDRFHLDQLRFWCGFFMIDTAGSFFNTQVRGAGWTFRCIGDLAAYMPDADPLKSYFTNAVTTNLTAFNAYATSHNGGTLEFLFPEPGASGLNGIATKCTALWANSYVAWGMDRCQAHGFGSSATFRNRVVRTQITFFSSAPDWPQAGAAPFFPVVGETTAGAYYNTMAECYDKTHEVYLKAFPPPTYDWMHQAMPHFDGYYGPEARMMLQIGVRESITGASAALNYLMAFAGVQGDLDYRSGWAVKAAVLP